MPLAMFVWSLSGCFSTPFSPTVRSLVGGYGDIPLSGGLVESGHVNTEEIWAFSASAFSWSVACTLSLTLTLSIPKDSFFPDLMSDQNGLLLVSGLAPVVSFIY